MTTSVEASLFTQYPLKPLQKNVRPFPRWVERRRLTLLQRAFVEGETKIDDWRAWTDEQALFYFKAVKRVIGHHQVGAVNSCRSYYPSKHGVTTMDSVSRRR